MKSFILSVVNIALIGLILVIIYLLHFDDGQFSESVLAEISVNSYHQESSKISMKQLDSLSASTNLHFSEYFASNLLPRE